MANKAYRWNYATGSDTAADTHPTVVVRIVTLFHKILVTYVIWPFIDNEAATLYSDGVAVGKKGMQICVVTAALITATLEISVLIKYNLEYKRTMIMLVVRTV